METALQTLSDIMPYISFGAVILLGISGKFGKIKTPFLEIEGASKTAGKVEARSIIQALDVRIYSNLLEMIKMELIKDIRYRVRRNGWLKLPDFPAYTQAAIESHDRMMTKFLDDHYPQEMAVERVELFEWNQKIKDEIWEKFRALYRAMIDHAYQASLEKEKLRERLQGMNGCIGNGGQCARISDILSLSHELYELDRIELKEKCMNEAERVLDDVLHRYYSHFLTIYKKKKGKDHG